MCYILVDEKEIFFSLRLRLFQLDTSSGSGTAGRNVREISKFWVIGDFNCIFFVLL